MNLVKNMLIEWTDKDKEEAGPSIERILYVGTLREPNGPATCELSVVTIDIDLSHFLNRTTKEKPVLPVVKSYSDIVNAIEAGDARILASDPFACIHRKESDISAEHREYRDRAWQFVSKVIAQGNGDDASMFDPRERGQYLAKAMKEFNCSSRTAYKWLRRYWQRGQTANALLPDFEWSGGKGKERDGSGRKPGRKSAYWCSLHAPEPEQVEVLHKQRKEVPAEDGQRIRIVDATTDIEKGAGIAITPEIREKLRKGIQEFYLDGKRKIPCEEKHITLNQAYQYTLEAYFSSGYAPLQPGQEKLRVILLPPEQRPTMDQFKYVYKRFRERNPEFVYVAREGSRAFKLKGRPVLGESTSSTMGPGSEYQVDATLGDIYLVSPFDRNRIIGKPVIYIVIDVFSRLVVGLSVLMEGPSWLGAMLAMENALSDKVPFCAEYDIYITEGDWPCHHAPVLLRGDGGEFKSGHADNLALGLDIIVLTTPSFRPDWKGIVECSIRTTKGTLPPWTPGLYYKAKVRGGHDYRLDATLTPHEFRQLLIYSILRYNKFHRISDSYPMNRDMLQDHVEPYPLDLWNWGVANSLGKLRAIDPTIAKLNLLPEGQASVTSRGIEFEGRLYTCELAEREQWFLKARTQRRWREQVAYDMRSLDVIYLRLDGGRQLEECLPLDEKPAWRGSDVEKGDEAYDIEHPYRHSGWYELKDKAYYDNTLEPQRATQEQDSAVEFNARTQEIIDKAKEATKRAKAQAGMSDSARLKNIRENRKEVAQAEREENAWELSSKSDQAGVVTPARSGNAHRRTEMDEEDEVAAWKEKDLEKLRMLQLEK